MRQRLVIVQGAAARHHQVIIQLGITRALGRRQWQGADCGQMAGVALQHAMRFGVRLEGDDAALRARAPRQQTGVVANMRAYIQRDHARLRQPLE